MKKIAIIAKKDEHSQKMKEKIKTALCDNKIQYDEVNPNLVLCIGGDGTLLYAVHKYKNHLEQCSFLGIHTGTLGFFMDYKEDDIEICINDILTKTPFFYERKLLEINLDGEKLYAVNEMRIENATRTLNLNIAIDNESFEVCKGTGICISTQAGSTAYNRSIGGAVIDSGLEVLELTEIASIQHSQYRSLGSPFIIKGTREIEITSNNFSESILCYDHLYQKLNNAKIIRCCLSNKKIRFCKYYKYSYLDKLKSLYN